MVIEKMIKRGVDPKALDPQKVEQGDAQHAPTEGEAQEWDRQGHRQGNPERDRGSEAEEVGNASFRGRRCG